MSSREAIRLLLESGFEFVRYGKGDHKIYKKGTEMVIVPGGKAEIRSGMVRRIENLLKKDRRGESWTG